MSRPYIAVVIIGLLISLLLQNADLPIVARSASSGDLATPTPAGPDININLYASVSSNGSGEASASAQLVNGQALASINSTGAGRGAAQAQAPVCAACQVISTTLPASNAPLAALPTKAQVVQLPTPTPAPINTPAPIAPAAQPTAHFVIAYDLVNVRQGPSMAQPIRRTVQRGQIVTRLQTSADGNWLRIGDNEWIAASLASADLSSQPVASSQQPATSHQLPATAPNGYPPLGQQPTAYPFTLELVERHTESNNVTLYSFIHEDNRALDGHYLAITKDGVAVPGPRERSAAVPLGTTRPACAGVIFDAAVCEQNHIYNLKQAWDTRLAYPNFSPWGEWRIQLVNGVGQPIGPPTTFSTRPGDANLELYVRYKKQ